MVGLVMKSGRRRQGKSMGISRLEANGRPQDMECLSVSHAIRGGHWPSAAAAGRRCRAEEGRGSRSLSLWEIIPLPTSVLQRRCWLVVKVQLPVPSIYLYSPTPVGAAATRRPLFSSYIGQPVKFQIVHHLRPIPWSRYALHYQHVVCQDRKGVTSTFQDSVSIRSVRMHMLACSCQSVFAFRLVLFAYIRFYF